MLKEEAIQEINRYLDILVYEPTNDFIKELISRLRSCGKLTESYDFGYRKEKLKTIIEDVIRKIDE